jgi:LPS export ABC transporter protein LptC
MKPRGLTSVLILGAAGVLGGCRPPIAVNAAGEPRNPPQSMTQMDAAGYSGSSMLWDVKSPKADVLDSQETLFLNQPNMKSFKDGRLDSTLTAEKGWLNTTRQDMLAQDNVVVTSTDGARLTTLWLILDNRTQVIHSTAPARIVRPGSITTGANLVATMNLSSISLTDEVVEIPKTEKKNTKK